MMCVERIAIRTLETHSEISRQKERCKRFVQKISVEMVSSFHLSTSLKKNHLSFYGILGLFGK